MNHKFNHLILITIILLLSSGCSTKNTSSQITNNEISPVANVASTDSQLGVIQNDIPLSVTYTTYEDKYRFISKSASLLWTPSESGPKVTDISNRLVEVLLAGYTAENKVWLFVTFQTYDTPTNNRGWILESNTEKYTEHNQTLVKDIIIPKGTTGADKNKKNVENYNQFGFILKQEQDRVLVMFSGGNAVWYYKKDINIRRLTNF